MWGITYITFEIFMRPLEGYKVRRAICEVAVSFES